VLPSEPSLHGPFRCSHTIALRSIECPEFPLQLSPCIVALTSPVHAYAALHLQCFPSTPTVGRSAPMPPFLYLADHSTPHASYAAIPNRLLSPRLRAPPVTSPPLQLLHSSQCQPSPDISFAAFPMCSTRDKSYVVHCRRSVAAPPSPRASHLVHSTLRAPAPMLPFHPSTFTTYQVISGAAVPMRPLHIP